MVDAGKALRLIGFRLLILLKSGKLRDEGSCKDGLCQ